MEKKVQSSNVNLDDLFGSDEELDSILVNPASYEHVMNPPDWKATSKVPKDEDSK